MELHIVCIPGDGIGPEIVREAKKVLEAVAQVYGDCCRKSHCLGNGMVRDWESLSRRGQRGCIWGLWLQKTVCGRRGFCASVL